MDEHTFIKSVTLAIEGIRHAIDENRNIRIHFIIAAFIIIAGVFLGLNKFEIIIIFVMTSFVISSEMINTSIEEMTNLITREHRKEAKIAKDVAAGMVLVASACAAVVGFIIFLPYISDLF
jgi:diacylglycerol kinase